jgi:hypothetical protein
MTQIVGVVNWWWNGEFQILASLRVCQENVWTQDELTPLSENAAVHVEVPEKKKHTVQSHVVDSLSFHDSPLFHQVSAV